MILKHNIDIKQLKPRGYKFGKFFASNYKAYSLDVGCKEIVVWVADKDIQIDWTYDRIDDIISHYKTVRSELVRKMPIDSRCDYFICYVSPFLYLPIASADKFRGYFMDDKICEEYYSGKYSEFVVSVVTMDKIVAEVEWLIGREIK